MTYLLSSISREALPEMAVRLARVRLAARAKPGSTVQVEVIGGS